jgi:hypothetical protein
MTVKELKAILNKVKDENLKVVMNGYYVNDVNGYYYDRKDEEDVLILTNNYVQPIVLSEHEV